MLQEAVRSLGKMLQGITDFVVPSENSQVIEMRETLTKSKERMDDMFQSVRRSYEGIKGIYRNHESFSPLFLASGDVQNDLNIASEKTDKISVQSYKDFLKEFSEIEKSYDNMRFNFANRVGQHIEDANNQNIRNLFFRMNTLTTRMGKFVLVAQEILQNT